jgi:hypothetical protein
MVEEAAADRNAHWGVSDALEVKSAKLLAAKWPAVAGADEPSLFDQAAAFLLLAMFK